MPGTPTTTFGIPTLAGGDQGSTIDNWSVAAMGALDTLLASIGAHVGDLKPTALGGGFPTGWLLCDGSAISRTTFATLFAAIGTTFGAGNGTTTFNVPDLRGRVPVGVDGAAGRLSANDALGQSGGEETHALLYGELGNGAAVGAPKGAAQNADAPTPHNNMQPYVIVNWLIKT